MMTVVTCARMEEYVNKTRDELIAVCKSLNISGYTKKKKQDIIALIQEATGTSEGTSEGTGTGTGIGVRFVDLFCGIGGFHAAISRVLPGSQCVMASDIDPQVRRTYEMNYHVKPLGDIKGIDIGSIPHFDLLCGGFPCQAFSIAQWKDKKAFDDPRGTLFFEILKFIDCRRPKCVLLENVAHLTKINKGVVLQTILNSLHARGYTVSYTLLSPHQFGVPQNRERVYIVATTLEQEFDFTSLAGRRSTCKLADILDPIDEVPDDHYIDESKYVLLDPAQTKKQVKSGLQFCGYLKGELRKVGARENTEHLSRTHKQLMRIYSSNGTHPTLAASETSGRYHIYDESTRRVRRLTLNECYKLMAYPATFIKHTTKGVAYKQIGNSVCVRVVEEILAELVKQGHL